MRALTRSAYESLRLCAGGPLHVYRVALQDVERTEPVNPRPPAPCPVHQDVPQPASPPEGGLRDTGGPRAVTQGTCRAPRHWQEVLIDSLVRVTLSRRALVRVGGTL